VSGVQGLGSFTDFGEGGEKGDIVIIFIKGEKRSFSISRGEKILSRCCLKKEKKGYNISGFAQLEKRADCRFSIRLAGTGREAKIFL